MMWMEEEMGMLATPGDAHREWHLNSGVPMGTPGCPQDACHPVDDYEYEWELVDEDDDDPSETFLAVMGWSGDDTEVPF